MRFEIKELSPCSFSISNKYKSATVFVKNCGTIYIDEDCFGYNIFSYPQIVKKLSSKLLRDLPLGGRLSTAYQSIKDNWAEQKFIKQLSKAFYPVWQTLVLRVPHDVVLLNKRLKRANFKQCNSFKSNFIDLNPRQRALIMEYNAYALLVARSLNTHEDETGDWFSTFTEDDVDDNIDETLRLMPMNISGRIIQNLTSLLHKTKLTHPLSNRSELIVAACLPLDGFIQSGQQYHENHLFIRVDARKPDIIKTRKLWKAYAAKKQLRDLSLRSENDIIELATHATCFKHKFKGDFLNLAKTSFKVQYGKI